MSPMDTILANACPTRVLVEGDQNNNRIGQIAEYWIESHCVGWTIQAKLIASENLDQTEANRFYQYEIISMVPSDC